MADSVDGGEIRAAVEGTTGIGFNVNNQQSFYSGVLVLRAKYIDL